MWVRRKTRVHLHERVKAGVKLHQKCSSLPSSCLWQDSCRRHTTSDLMSMKSRSSGFEVILLASPSHPGLDSGFFEAFVTRYSGTLPRGIYTRFPILP